MPALVVAAGRQTSTAVLSAGLADVVVPLVDAADAATTVVPAVGDHLVLAFCNITNDSDNNNGAEVRCEFGGTTYARSASTMRFANFGTNPSRGSQLASAFVVTGDASSELRLVGRGLSGGADAQCSSGNIVAVPTADLGDFQSQESANSDAAATTPTTGWTALGTDLTFSPSSDGDYVLIASVEVFGDGTSVNADEVAVRCRFGPDGTPTTVQQETFHERDQNFPVGEIQHSYRWVTEQALTSGTTYRLSIEADGTEGNGNFPGRRVRFFAFRSDSVNVYRGVSTGGVDETGATGPFTLPGLSIAIPDPGEANVLHTYLGQTEAQTTQFADVRLVQGANEHPPNGTFRGVDDNGTGVGDDITLVPLQSHEVLASGSAYTVTGRVDTYGSGDFSVGMLRGGASFVPAEFLAIAWQTPAAPAGFDVSGDFGGSAASFDATLEQASGITATFGGSASSLDATVALQLAVAATFSSPGGGALDLDLLTNPAGTFGGSDASLDAGVDLGSPPVAADFGGSAASLAAAVDLVLPVAGDFGGSSTSFDATLEQVPTVVGTFGGSAASLAAAVTLSTPVAADFGGSGASLVANVSGLVTVVFTGQLATSHTTRRLVTQQGTRMGQPWYVNPEDEGQTLSERIVYPAVTEHREVIEVEEPADLSGVQTVGLEVWNANASEWVPVAGSGEVTTETGPDSQGATQTWYVANFTPSTGALQTVADLVGRGSHRRRWVFGLGGGQDQRAPSSGHETIHLNEHPV